MIKKSLLLASCALMAAGVSAETLTPAQALDRLNNDTSVRKVRSGRGAPALVHTQMATDGTPSVYLFNEAGDNGYLAVSADDLAMPLLGYADSGSIDADNLPPQLEYWLGEYSRQIEYARAKGATAADMAKAPEIPADWTPITPQVTAMWNQTEPYNEMCPEYMNRRCVTGCVATAIAQVMHYWKSPVKGTGRVNFYSNQQIGQLSMDFSEREFDWSNMLDQYVAGNYSQANADAVAYLMKACGYMTHMSYGTGVSGAVTPLMGPALVEHFGYDRGINIQARTSFSATEWNKMVYENLRDVGPIIYSANSPEGGHCFVLDGYDTSGYFHFNWGWGGMCNGYYTLNALNPVMQGTGGYYGGYNFSQEAIFGIQPSKGGSQELQAPTLTAEGYLEVTNARNVLQFRLTNGDPVMWGNNSFSTIQAVFGMCVEPASGQAMDPMYVDCTSVPMIELTPGSWLNAIGFVPLGRVPSNLADGKYKVTLLVREVLDPTSWRHVNLPYGNHDYVYVTKEGNNYTVEQEALNFLTIPEAEIVTDLYFNNACRIRMHVVNDTDYELTQAINPRLLDAGTPAYTCDSRRITLAPHSSEDMEFTFLFSRQQDAPTPTVKNPLELEFDILNYETGDTYGNYGFVEMKRNASSVKLRMSNFAVNGYVEEGMSEHHGYVYGIDNFSSISVSGSLSVEGGMIASPIVIEVTELEEASNATKRLVFEDQLPDTYFVSTGNPQSFAYSFSIDNPSFSSVYKVECFSISGNSRTSLGVLRLAASSGVGTDIAEAEGLSLEVVGDQLVAAGARGVVSLAVYAADGSAAASAAADGAQECSISLDGLAGGVYIAVATDRSGNTRTVKFIR